MIPTVFYAPKEIVYVEGAATLGIQIRSTTELLEHLDRGFDAAIVRRLAKHMGLGLDLFLIQAGISSRSIKTALKAKSRLSTGKSETLYRIGRIFERAVKVFQGDKEKAACWMLTPKFGLNNTTPLRFVRTEVGGESVFALLDELIDGGVA